MSLDLSSSGSDASPHVETDVARVSRLPRLTDTRILSASACFVIVCALGWTIFDGSARVETLLIGYSALASTLGLALLATSEKARPRELDRTAPFPLSEPSAAWKLLTTYAISDASRLWCNIEPGAAATHDSMAWGCALLDAIKAGQLPIATSDDNPTSLEWERRNPHYMTRVTRQSLKQWASEKGHNPSFLRD